MKVFLNGAGGFIGSHLIEELVKSGHKVSAVDMPNVDMSHAEKLGCEVAYATLEDADAIKEAMTGCDAVIHTAAIFNFAVPMDKIWKVNVEGTKTVCDIATELGVKKFVMFSTVGSYGRPVKVPCKEEDPKNPRNPYEITKWESEKLAFKYHKERGLPVVAIRPTLVYGPRSRYGVIQYLCALTLLKLANPKRKLMVVKGGYQTHMVHVEDVARAVVFLMEHDDVVGKVYNIVDDDPLTTEQYLLTLYDAVGIEPRFKIPIIPFVWRKTAEFLAHRGHVLINRFNRRLRARWEKVVKEHSLIPAFEPDLHLDWLLYASAPHYYDNSKLKALGFELKHPKFSEGLKNVAEWYRENRWLPRV